MQDVQQEKVIKRYKADSDCYAYEDVTSPKKVCMIYEGKPSK